MTFPLPNTRFFRNPKSGIRGAYRYGFNGKELDKEGMGGGATTYDYGFRIYNAALGKFLSVDPLAKRYGFYTPYQFAGNHVIQAVDIDGLEQLDYRVLAIDQNGNAILELSVRPGTTSRDRRGRLVFISRDTGNAANTTGSILVDRVLNVGSQIDTYPNIEEGTGGTFTPGAGSDSYLIKLDVPTLNANNVNVVDRNNEGNYIESNQHNNANTLTSTTFILSIPPFIPTGTSGLNNFYPPNTPSYSSTDFTNAVLNSVAQATASTGQANNQITSISITYPNYTQLTAQLTGLTANLQAAYPNATITFNVADTTGDVTSVDSTVVGSPIQQLTLGQ